MQELLLVLQSYHVTAKLVVQKVCGYMSWQQVEENTFVAMLQGIHLTFLLIGLKENKSMFRIIYRVFTKE
jgi:hypothetical protein